MKLLRNIFFETPRNSLSIVSRKVSLRRRGLHRFDALDRVDLVRAYLPWLSSMSGEQRPQHLHAKNTSSRHRAAWSRGRRRRATGCRCAMTATAPTSVTSESNAADAVLHGKLPHLPRAFEPALDVARAAAVEIPHRQREQLPREEIEDRRVDAHRGKAEQVLLRERWRAA